MFRFDSACFYSDETRSLCDIIPVEASEAIFFEYDRF